MLTNITHSFAIWSLPAFAHGILDMAVRYIMSRECGRRPNAHLGAGERIELPGSGPYTGLQRAECHVFGHASRGATAGRRNPSRAVSSRTERPLKHQGSLHCSAKVQTKQERCTDVKLEAYIRQERVCVCGRGKRNVNSLLSLPSSAANGRSAVSRRRQDTSDDGTDPIQF